MTACTVDRLLSSSRALLGTVEHPDGSNHVPGVTDWYGIDPGPWCAMSVSRAFFDAGFVDAVSFSTTKGFAYCPAGIAGFQARGAWHNGTSGIAAGDVVFFDWEGDGTADHVGIVESVEGDGVHTLEGNSDNRYERRIRRANIVGYGRPKYAGSPAPQPPPTNGGLFVSLTPEEEQEILAAARVINAEVNSPTGSGSLYSMVSDLENGKAYSKIDRLRELVVKIANKVGA